MGDLHFTSNMCILTFEELIGSKVMVEDRAVARYLVGEFLLEDFLLAALSALKCLGLD